MNPTRVKIWTRNVRNAELPLPSGVLAGLCPACLFKQGAAADTAKEPPPAPFEPPSIAEVARLFPQLEILALIGQGGMGAVYRARQPGLDRVVALKILPPQTAGGPGFVERFNREARALARLNHPNIVAVYEFGQADGLPFFIMEFVDGLNLRQLERAGKLAPREALQIVPQICEALQFAHDEGIVHRDIKPENILVDKKGRVKIADFGIAKILGQAPDAAITETKGAIGTPHYMAPEQLERPTTVDHRADIFSLGVVFYEMLTGELPLGRFAAPSSCKVEVDVRLDDVVLRALEKDPERRYQHASQVKTAVDTIAGSAPSAPAANGGALAREILARGYQLNIGSCLRRAWALMRGDFWPIFGVTALILALYVFAGSLGERTLRGGPHGDFSFGFSVLTMLVYGPLFGGLSLYFLKKIRGEPTTIETAFSGFSQRFLHLFLAGFVTTVLMTLGFVCFLLPGIYLMVAWWFTLTLVIDKRVDFWSAMEASRKVVTRHWWKFFGFFLVVLLMYAAGLLFLIVGVLVTAPIAMIAVTYAYEDIFGAAGAAANLPPAGAGPSGTVVLPRIPPIEPGPTGGGWRPGRQVIALAIWLVLAGAMMWYLAVERPRHRARREEAAAVSSRVEEQNRLEKLAAEAREKPDLEKVVRRAKQELGHISVRFSGLRISEPGEDSFVVSFSGLEKQEARDGAKGWRSITGSLAAERAEGNKWIFQGQDQLQAVRFDIAELDRDKLVEQANAEQVAVPGDGIRQERETLNARLEAASEISDGSARSEAMAAVATDAARAGVLQIVQSALPQIIDNTKRNETAYESAGLLAKFGLRKEALAVAKEINDINLRDKALSELAR